jgi:hypothetical protein
MPRGGSVKPGRQVDGVHSHAWLHAPVAKQVVLATRAQREAELPKLEGPFKQEPGCSADGMRCAPTPKCRHVRMLPRPQVSGAWKPSGPGYSTSAALISGAGCVKGVAHRS